MGDQGLGGNVVLETSDSSRGPGSRRWRKGLVEEVAGRLGRNWRGDNGVIVRST